MTFGIDVLEVVFDINTMLCKYKCLDLCFVSPAAVAPLVQSVW